MLLTSNIGRLVFAYEDVHGGATNCDVNLFPPAYRKSKLSIVSGTLREESLFLFKQFFESQENTYLKGSALQEYTMNQSEGVTR